MNTTHFTSGNYTIIRNDIGQYQFQGTGKYDMLQHYTRLHEEIEQRQRQIKALAAFLDGDSVSDPAALRF